MNDDGDLDYALARIAACRARRPGAAAWRAIEALRGYAAALAAARSAGFDDWLRNVDADSDPHAIEAALRAAWRADVARLARWMPARWRAALDACADWIDLPRLRAAHARDMRDGDGATPPHEPPARPDANVDAAWQAQLLQRLRAAGASRDPAFTALGRMLDAHRRRFAELPPGNGWPRREALESALLAFLHAGPPGPAFAFAWIGLLALGHERLRGALVARAAMEAAP